VGNDAVNSGAMMKNTPAAIGCLLLLFFPVSPTMRAQSSPAVIQAPGCVTETFVAPHLGGSKVKFSVILPRDYAVGERRFPVLYLLHGFGGHYSDWCTHSHIVEYAKRYEEIIVMPEGANSWYVNNYTNPKMQWEDYIIEDLIPYVDAHYRTVASRPGRTIAGLSMGGYGALFLGLRHHDTFAAVASLSGVVASANLPRWDEPLVETEANNKAYDGIRKALAEDFGPQDNPARNGEDPFLLVRQLTQAQCPDLYISVGAQDNLAKENLEFVQLLHSLKIIYGFTEVPGKHEWPVWDSQIKTVLLLQSREIGSQPASKK
jgi:putative tributyrin esterase